MGRHSPDGVTRAEDALAALSRIVPSVKVIKARQFFTWSRADERELELVTQNVEMVKSELVALRTAYSEAFQRPWIYENPHRG